MSVGIGPHMQISASMMCADFRNLSQQLLELEAAGVTRLHLDFADGHFVPNVLLGTEVFQLLPSRQRAIRECHLMMREPTLLLDIFLPHSDLIIVHVEAMKDAGASIRKIRESGVRPGLALNPETPAAAVEPFVSEIDLLLFMTVTPGFAGQAFRSDVLPKIRALRQIHPAIDIAVDGAVNPTTIPLLAAAGANVFVGGSTGLFTAVGIRQSAVAMRRSWEGATKR